MIVMNALRMTALLAVLSLLGACAEMGQVMDAADIRTPAAQVTSVNIMSLSQEAVGLDLTLAVDNPNVIPVKLAGFDYTLQINGQQLSSGQQRQGVKIPARGRGEVHVPVQLRMAELATLVKGWSNTEQMNYGVQVSALVDLPVLGMQALPAETQGVLPVPKLPQITLSGIKVRKLGLTGADLDVGIMVKNPNAFGVDIRKLVYQLNVNGKTWLSSTLKQTLSLAERGSQQLNVPVSLNLVEIGSGIASALDKSAPLSYRLNGDMNFDTSLPQLKDVAAPFDLGGKISISK